MDSIEMYKENILENYKNPQNYGKIENPTHSAKSYNKSCGDEIEIDLILNNKEIKEIKFSGKGCAICIATSSILTQKAKNLNKDKIQNLNKEDILKMLNIPISPVRLKCALLPLETLQKAIHENEDTRN